MQHFDGNKLIALILETLDDFTGQATSNPVGLSTNKDDKDVGELCTDI